MPPKGPLTLVSSDTQAWKNTTGFSTHMLVDAVAMFCAVKVDLERCGLNLQNSKGDWVTVEGCLYCVGFVQIFKLFTWHCCWSGCYEYSNAVQSQSKVEAPSIANEWKLWPCPSFLLPTVFLPSALLSSGPETSTNQFKQICKIVAAGVRTSASVSMSGSVMLCLRGNSVTRQGCKI